MPRRASGAGASAPAAGQFCARSTADTAVAHRHGSGTPGRRARPTRRASALSTQHSALFLLPLWFVIFIWGCDGTARVSMSAGGAIDRLASQFETTGSEYHEEVKENDNRRVEDIVGALLVRIRNSQSQEEEAAASAAFMEALRGINDDRDVEIERWLAHRDNVRTLREVGEGLNRIGLASLGLSDEVSRYITGWAEARAEAAARREQEKAAKQQQRQANVQALLGAAGLNRGGVEVAKTGP